MRTQTQIGNRTATTERGNSGDMVVGFAVLGCLIAGAVGIDRALSMQSGFDVLLCLLGSVAAFGMVFYIYFRRS
jgi:hypothetical protein